MESSTPELSAVRLPRDERDRSIRPGRPVFELLELWGKGEEGAGGWKGDRSPAQGRAECLAASVI